MFFFSKTEWEACLCKGGFAKSLRALYTYTYTDVDILIFPTEKGVLHKIYIEGVLQST